MVFIDFRFIGKKREDNTFIKTIMQYNEVKKEQIKAKAKAKYKKSRKSRISKPSIKLYYIDRFHIKTLKDLDRPGIKAAITRCAKKEAVIMDTTVEDRIHRITAGIKCGLVKRAKKRKAA